MKNQTTIIIPKKYQHMIDEIYHDSDGYWCYTAYGFYSPYMDCHTIHEDTQADILSRVRGIEPCDCDECLKELAKQKLA